MPLLFSYGTLQESTVQLELFGRLLEGEPDELVGFARSTKVIDDAAFVAKSGKAEHAVVILTGNREHRVRGTVFDLSDAELGVADRYEPAGYERIKTTLFSGREAWVYAGMRSS
ncbi:MAG TPA: gamma-glutamylcyclotransferase family protein [Stellaceae bacterium]|nr:gamma-glutamylcyclotransferase family protein [Stellaceae bacterium]